MSTNLEWNKKNWSDKKRWESEWGQGYAWGGEASVRADFSRFVTPYMLNMENPEILEIACGMGRFTKLLLEVAGKLHSIDLQKICVEHCKKLFSKEKKFSASVTDGKTLPNGEFDMVVSYDSLVHADFDVLQHYFAQAQERLRTNGVVIIHHANRPDPSCSRFCVTSDMVKEYIETLPELTLVSQTLFRYSESRFVDCVTVCRKVPAMTDGPYKHLGNNLYVRNPNRWSVIAGFLKDTHLHPNSIGAAPMSVLEKGIAVDGKSTLVVTGAASNENDINPGAVLKVKLLADGKLVSETPIDFGPRENVRQEIPIPSGLKSLDLEVSIENRPGSVTNQCAGVFLKPIELV